MVKGGRGVVKRMGELWPKASENHRYLFILASLLLD